MSRRRKYQGPAKKSRPTVYEDGPGPSSFDINPETWTPLTHDPEAAAQWKREVPIARQPRLPGLEAVPTKIER